MQLTSNPADSQAGAAPSQAMARGLPPVANEGHDPGASWASLRRVTIVVAVAALVVQAVSATFWVDAFRTPNFATEIAQHLAERGVYAGGAWWRLKGPHAGPQDAPLRAFHLPGEPLYLAAGFRLLPEPAWRYLHVPVTAAFLTAVSLVAGLLAGPRAGLAAGLVAVCQPFVIFHGPVWDDTFLGAGLDWLLLAVLAYRLAQPSGAPTAAPSIELHAPTPTARARPTASPGGGPALARSLAWLAFPAGLAAWAALTRTQSQATVALVCLAAWVIRPLAPIRREATAAFLGMAAALGLWGLRNGLVLGTFLVGSTHDGITLWESNYPHACEALLTKGQVERLNSERMADDFAQTASLDEVEADRYFRQRALRHLREHPAEVLENGWIKLLVTATGIRPELGWRSPRNLAALGSNAVLFALALAGIAWGQRRGSAGVITLSVIAGAVGVVTTLGLTVIGPVGWRYRIGLDAWLWVAGGMAVAAGYERWRRRCTERGPSPAS